MKIVICPQCGDTAAAGMGWNTCPNCKGEMKEIEATTTEITMTMRLVEVEEGE